MTGTTTRQSRIGATFARLREVGETGVFPYVTVGHPELDTAQLVVPALVAGGAAMVELGIPFSDPLADGATIQASSHAALENGVTVAYCLQTARDLRHEGVDVPLIFMGYYNPLLSYGLERFAADCADAGVDGIIVPDLPPDESGELLEACRRHGRDLIFMVAPTNTDEHLAAVGRQASGFIYCVSLTGVTGARSALSAGLDEFIARVKRHTDLPLVIGFGISAPEHVARAGALAEGVAVGSALVGLLGDTPRERQPEEVRGFIARLRGA
ncbi:MAG TPA: tryptophan synthase subunit alpha [Thermomicrobiaceae bacterium]|nr:tryptophan synthase subunit alpha [Thermomicrobiaceae bacterium]